MAGKKDAAYWRDRRAAQRVDEVVTDTGPDDLALHEGSSARSTMRHSASPNVAALNRRVDQLEKEVEALKIAIQSKPPAVEPGGPGSRAVVESRPTAGVPRSTGIIRPFTKEQQAGRKKKT